MFDFLKGGKDRLTLDLDRQSKTYYPGETINVEVGLATKKELKTEGGRVEFIRRESYQTLRIEENFDQDGYSHSSNRRKREQSEEIISQFDFMGPGEVIGQHSFSVQLDLPAGAIPTYAGKIIGVEWLVKAVIDRRHRLELNEEASVEIRLPSQPYVIHQQAGLSSKPKDVNLSFQLPDDSWDFYRPLTGNLLILPLKDINVKGYRVDLVRVESVPGPKDHISTQIFEGESHNGAELREGNSAVIPFQIEMPEPRLTTLQTENWSVSWQLKATLFRSWRKDTYLVDELLIG